MITPDQTWLILACVVAGATASIWLEQRFRWAARIGGPVLVLGFAMALSNARILPWNATVYDVVDDYLVPIAIPLLLLRANVAKILRESGSLFAAFHVAAFGTLVGAFLAGFLFQTSVPRTPEVTGIMAASYIGGGVNFVAIRESYRVESELAGPLIVADNFIMAAMFGVLILLAGSRWMRRHFPHPHSPDDNNADTAAVVAHHWQRKDIALLDIAQALGLAVLIAAAGMTLTGWIKQHLESRLALALFANPFVLITFISVTVTTVAHRWTDDIRGGDEMGMFLLYLFFFVLGVRADLMAVIRNVPVLFLFCLVMATTNLAVTLLLGRWLRFNLEDLLLAVNATLGGAPSAAAMAISRAWSALVLPGLLVGIWGYVIGTPAGILVVECLRRLLGPPS